MSNIWEKENDVGNDLNTLSDGGVNISIGGEDILIHTGIKTYKKSEWNKES